MPTTAQQSTVAPCRGRWNKTLRVLITLSCALLAAPASATEIPYFARKYGVSCTQCHIAPPKLNEFGQEFVARGYRMPGLIPRPTIPLALWVSGRSESLGLSGADAERVRAYLNRVEVISGGTLVAPWLSYFVEWRPVSHEAQRDGTLRDRSGRFEDLFVSAMIGSNLELTAGQFRQIAQVDVSQRLSLSEPLVFAASLAGNGGGSAREQALRAFSPAGRSPALRAAWVEVIGPRARWTTSLAVPVPGEVSIPLTSDARINASNEIEWSPKGILLESFVRSGLASAGMHAFYDDSRRYLVQGVATGSTSGAHPLLLWTAAAGVDRLGETTRGRWSLEGEVVPRSWLAFGTRAEDRTADGLGAAVIPYINLHAPGTRYTVRLTVERRLQRDRHATVVELGTVF